IIQKLKKLGFKVIVLNKEKNWAQAYADHWILADNTNHAQSLQAVQMFISSHPDIKIDGVLTFWEDDVLLTAKIVDKFNLTGIPYSIALKVRNKFLFRDFCSENKILAPKYHLIRTQEDIDYISENFTFPVVIKPAFGSSSAFVVKVESKAYLKETYEYVQNNISSGVESSLNDGLDIFAEEFIDGDEVDIDILIQNGKIKFYSIADNYNKSKGIFFVDSGQAIPSRLPTESQDKLIETAEEVLEKLGIQNGCIHFEAKCAKNGIYPIEINMRMGGDYVYSYTKGAWNIDLIEYAAKIAIGEYVKIKKPAAPKKYIIGWDLHSENSGILVELDVPEDIKKYKWIEEMQIYKSIGDPLFIPPEGFEHLGWLTVSGENLLDAQDNLDETLKKISYKVVKFDPDASIGKTERKNRFSPAVLNKKLLLRTAKIDAIRRLDFKNQRNLRIGLLCNIYPESTDPIEINLTLTAKEIEETLTSIGYNVTILNPEDLYDVVEKLKRGDIDLVFNVAEKLYNSYEYKSQIASLLDVLQIPYTGASPFTLSLATDKIRFKKLLAYHEIPTPNWDYVYEPEDEIEDELEYPLILKPSNTDHSVGISEQSVVTNKQDMYKQLNSLMGDIKRPVLIEEYIEGDEYEVYILGNDKHDLQVLPLSRTIFTNFAKDKWHIFSYETKWTDKQQRSELIRQFPPKNISKKLESLITEIALDTYNIFDCRDYGKVEIKVDKDNNPYVIELNPNPWLSGSGKGMVSAAKVIGMRYGELLEEIIRMSVERYQKTARVC
ncbi:ATP-grasp domain-containing protein, partial [Candidatus Peregrinibacteria bacterium]|nr:ATP-grasp domain-containing protein [Candidatus Peregrinibacteria bacterium]